MVDVAEVLQRAQLLANLGYLQDADDLIRAGLAEEPDDPDLLAALAELAFQSGDFHTALNAAYSAIENEAGSAPIARTVLARMYLAAGLTDDAIDIARDAVELNPTDAGTQLLLANCLSHGMTFGANRRDTVAAIDRAVELDPANADLLFEAARVAKRINDGDRVTSLVQAGLQVDPAHGELQTMHALGQALTGEQVGALTAILAEDPTHRWARHALAEAVWGAIGRLASGVWIYTLAMMLLSAWIAPELLRHLAPVLMAPLIVHWTGVFIRLRKRLPRGYLSKRLWRNPSSASGMVVAAIAALVANLSPLLIALGWNPDGVRSGYWALIVACLLAGLSHLLVTMGRIRRGGDVDLRAHLDEQEGNWAVWLVGLGVPIAVCWACQRFANQPGALWFALMLLPIVMGVLCMETNIKILRLPGALRYKVLTLVFGVLFVAGCGWLVTVCGQHVQAIEFRYSVGPLSPGQLPTPVIRPVPTFHFEPSLRPTR